MKISRIVPIFVCMLFPVLLIAQAPAPATLSNLAPKLNQSVLKVVYYCQVQDVTTGESYPDPLCPSSSQLDQGVYNVFSFTQSPTFDDKGNLFFTPPSDGDPNVVQLATYSPKGTVIHWADLPQSYVCAVSPDGLTVTDATVTYNSYAYNVASSSLWIGTSVNRNSYTAASQGNTCEERWNVAFEYITTEYVWAVIKVTRGDN